ncbi:MAG: carboxypeptidase-like regulatory domain-containing protein [Bacteroidota bacterium]
MRNSTIKFLLFFIAIGPTIQSQESFYGKVVNSKTKEGIPFVNIGFIDLGIGTVSNEEGEFLLEFYPGKIGADAVLQFSSLGYAIKKIEYSNASQFFDKELVVVYMDPQEMELAEVEVYNDGEFISDNVGYRSYGEEYFGYWKDNMALGGELATRVLVRDGLRKLHSLEFTVKENVSDSLLLRINIYDDDGGINRMPGTNLNKSGKDILYVLKAGQESILIDLNPFEIVVMNDFIASLELLEVYGKSPPGLALEASYNGFGSFRKYTSQDKWVRISSVNMAYFLRTSLLVSKREAARFEKEMERKLKRQRTISGFVLSNSTRVSDVLVRNLRTRDTVRTDNGGRYAIHAKRGDVLSFYKYGYKAFSQEVSGNLTLDARMQKGMESIDVSGLKPAIPQD